ncbi:hypothetical protein Leryth_009105 [Lithospermum erythrorhizon]|nr:hypothetical protein Leryth_009105 [Lithospermum erythrorhizon]
MGKFETQMYCFPVLGSIKHGGFCFRVVFINPFVVGFVSLSFSDVSLDELCNGLFYWVVWVLARFPQIFSNISSLAWMECQKLAWGPYGLVNNFSDLFFTIDFVSMYLVFECLVLLINNREDDILRIQSFELIPQLLEDEGGSLCGLPRYGCFCGDLIDLVVDVKSEAFVGPCEFWSVIEGLGGTAYVAGIAGILVADLQVWEKIWWTAFCVFSLNIIHWALKRRPKKLACCNDVFPVARVTLPVSHAG